MVSMGVFNMNGKELSTIIRDGDLYPEDGGCGIPIPCVKRPEPSNSVEDL